MYFTDDELNLMMIYNPGTRIGLIKELTNMQESLTARDRNLRKWTREVLRKLNLMTDDEFQKLELYPNI